MDEPHSPLVLTKLRMPAARPARVPRHDLIDLLAAETGASLVLVCAPAGYGKTTLLAEWARSLAKGGIAVAWYSLDPGDDNPIPFGSYLLASLIQALGPIPELLQLAQLLRSSPEVDLQRILPTVINAIDSSGRKCMLVLDDYHLITSPAIHTALAYLLEHLPAGLRIAIGSRSDPALPLARLRARGLLLEVRTAGLRFTSDETAQFLNEVMQLELSPAGIAELEARTEGWVAGLQLAALSLASRADREQLIASFTGSHRYLVEYLMEEVINQQPEQVRLFLMATSILERLCASLCNALIENREWRMENSQPTSSLDSRAILELLDRSNLFLIPLDAEGGWYRYHHLFRDFLQARLNQTEPQRIHRLHRAACEWLAAHGYLREAAGHAFQAGDWGYAAAFVEQHSFTLIIHSDIATIYEWCSAFPEDVFKAHPMLCLLQGLALAYGFRRQNRDRVVARLIQAERAIAAIKDEQVVRELLDMAGVVRTFLAMAPDPAADPQGLLALSQDMLGAYPEGDPAQFSGLLLTGYAYLALHEASLAEHAFETARRIALSERLYFGVVESTFHLARLLRSRGELHRAAELCRQGQTDIAAVLANPEQELPALGSLEVELGTVLLEQDRLGEAEEHLRRGLERMGGGMHPYYLMIAYMASFRLSELQGRLAEAHRFLERLEAAWSDIAFLTRGLRLVAVLQAAPEDPAALAEAAAWCRAFSSEVEGASPPGMGPFGAAEAYYRAYLAWAALQVALGNPQAALPTLEQQLDLASTHGLVERVIELSLLEAQARSAQGEDERTWEALERALAAAQPKGYVRIFDQGASLTRLLVEAVRRGISPDYVRQVLAVIAPPETPGKEQAGEHLSERELEVLRCMARGASNLEIAEQLVITVGTVKSHINHILFKLDAHNRTAAVARARALGLLDTDTESNSFNKSTAWRAEH